MKKLLLLLIACPLLSFAQNIRGKVFSQQYNLPIENTNVFLVLSKAGSITNSKGEFSISIFQNSKMMKFLNFLILAISLKVFLSAI